MARYLAVPSLPLVVAPCCPPSGGKVMLGEATKSVCVCQAQGEGALAGKTVLAIASRPISWLNSQRFTTFHIRSPIIFLATIGSFKFMAARAGVIKSAAAAPQ